MTPTPKCADCGAELLPDYWDDEKSLCPYCEDKYNGSRDMWDAFKEVED